ncbi:MAG: hypothetical protein RIQ71_21 [Verrucomicrobiota bacterium]|jgi:hypothetical protein
MLAGLGNFLARWGWAVLAVFAFVYYSQYFRSGLNLGGEGGTNAVLALRLMEGQRPIIDTFLGYNLLWFYPIVALFKCTGPDYTALRIFFFLICAVNALLGFAVVHAATRRSWLAFATGILLVLVPGMIFRNYMGLIGVLSMSVLLKAYVLPAPSERVRFRWMLAAGAAMSLCFLLRIEPSLLLTIVWLGLASLYPLGSRGSFFQRLRASLSGTFAAILVFAAMHGIFAWHANARGFGKEFAGQYTGMVGYFGYELSQQLKGLRSGGQSGDDVSVPHTTPDSGCNERHGSIRRFGRTCSQTEPKQSEWVQDRLGRPPVGEIWKAKRERDRYFAICLYYPVFWSTVFSVIAIVMLVSAISRGDSADKERALIVLTTTGCALSLFPQYFFFRPDAPHFSEFMVPFLPAVACSSSAVWDAARASSRNIWRYLAWVLTAVSTLLVPLYLKAIMPRESAGTWFHQGKTVEFTAANGVRVKVTEKEAHALEGLRDAVWAHSGPDDYVVCYPYAPTVNFMTARRSYEHNLYIDDATAGAHFERGAIERAQRLRPAVFVIDNRPINGSEPSRFANWAHSFMEYLRGNFRLVGTFQYGSRELYVYARPDKID